MGALLPALGMFAAFFAVLFIIYGISRPNQKAQTVDERLRELTPRAKTIDEIELQKSLAERLFKPLFGSMSSTISKYTPLGVVENSQRKLMHAGYPRNMQVADFMGLKGICTVLIGGSIGGLLLLAHQGILVVAAFGGIGAFAGYIFPDLWLGSQVKKRKKAIVKAMPDSIDLLTISVEAGLGFDAGLARIVEKADNALTREFSRVITEVRMGVPRRDALKALVERTGVEDLSIFVTSILQAEQLGVSVVNVLRVQTEEMRARRRQKAEQLAHTAAIKLLFPMAFLIFPPMFIIILGPAVPTVVNLLAPGFPL